MAKILYILLVLILAIVGFSLAFFPERYVAISNWWLRRVGAALLKEGQFRSISQRLSGAALLGIALWMLWGALR
jgi:hypothetical protein